MEESVVSAATICTKKYFVGINNLVITQFCRSRPPKLHKNILGKMFS